MKRFLVLGLMCTLLQSCGDSQKVNGVTCETYGFLTNKPSKCKDVEYRVVGGNIVWSIIMGASIVPPLLILGLDMWEPVPREVK